MESYKLSVKKSLSNSFAINLADNSIDKLVDVNGNYIQQTLP